MAVELRLGDRHLGRREHDYQRGYAGDAVVGGAQGGGIASTTCRSTLPKAVAAKAACRGIFRHRLRGGRLGSAIQHRTHPACSSHLPKSEGTVRELDDALGIDSVMGERLVRRGQNDQREVGNSLAVLRSFLV